MLLNISVVMDFKRSNFALFNKVMISAAFASSFSVDAIPTLNFGLCVTKHLGWHQPKQVHKHPFGLILGDTQNQ